MILYNVTVNVETEIEQEWLQWMKQSHVPNVLSTGFFRECRSFRLLTEEPQGTTYAFQYSADSMNDIDQYLAGPASDLQKAVLEKYGTKIMAFRTALEEIFRIPDDS